MLQDAVTAGLQPKHAVEAVVVANLDALDGVGKATAKLYIHKRDSATEPGPALVSVANVAHSSTLNSGMVRCAAPLKPSGDTMHAFTPSYKDSDSQTQISPRNNEDSEKHNPERQIFSIHHDAARLWTCVWHPPMQQQPEGTLHKQPLIVKSHIKRVKLLTFEVRASSTVRLCGQQMVARTQQSP